MSFIFNKGLAGLADGSIDLDTDTIKALAATTASAGTPDPDHDFLSDLLSAVLTEVSATGYSRATLTSGTVTEDDTDDEAEVDFADLDFGSAVAVGEVVKGFILYKQVGGDDLTPADDVLIAWIDKDSVGAFSARTGGGLVLGGGPLTIQVNTEGLIKFQDGTV